MYKKIKLLVIVTGLSAGGAELMLFRLLKYLDRSRFNILVVSLTSAEQVGVMMAEEGISVHALGANGFFEIIQRFPSLIKLIKKFNPDLVQTWMYHADLVGGLAARIAGVKKIIWSIRNSDLSFNSTKISTYVVAKLSAFASSWLPVCIINCSEGACASHVRFGYNVNKMIVIPNGIDLHRFMPISNARKLMRSELGLSSDVSLIGLIGRYHPIKNHAGFIDAALRISRIDGDVNFLLAGDGVDKSNNELTRLIQSANLLHRFHLLGRRSDMPLVMSSLDVLVSSSFGEAFPNVLAEAMSCGIPCVATDVGDSAYIIGDTGKIVPVNDPVVLSQSVLEMLNLHHKKKYDLACKARARITQNFDIKKISSMYKEIYENYFDMENA